MSGIIGFTSKLELDPGTGTFELVIGTTTVTSPAREVSMLETSWLGMADRYRTYTPGLIDPGNVSFEANYSKETYMQLDAVYGLTKIGGAIPPTGADIRWKVTFPDEDGVGTGTGQTFTFNGSLEKLTADAEIEAVMKIKGEIKISGAVAIA